ncbi:MAG: MFS transporter, partial [Thermoanaerobaculia bacterium]
MGGGWLRKLGLERRVGALALGLFVYGFGQELWFRYLPEYLRVLGASAFTVGAFGTLKDLLDAAYAYPGGVVSDRLGSRNALLLFGLVSAAGFGLYLAWSSVPALFCGLVLVMAWPALGLPATFALVGEELRGGRRIVGFTVQAVLKRIPIVLAPPLGGLLIERLGIRNGLRVGFAISVVLALAMLAALRRAFREEKRHTSPREADPRPAVRLHRSLKRLLIADCLVRFCEGLPDVFLVIWALEIARVSPVQFGLLTAVLMGTAILSYVPAAALAEGAEKKKFVVLTYFFFTLFPVAVVLSRSFRPLVLAYVVGGLREIGEPARKSLIVDLAEPLQRGRTVGLYYSIRGFAVAGAAAIGGALWTIRPEVTFAVAAGLGMLGTLVAAV